MLVLKEKSWNMCPYLRAVVTNDFFKTNFRIELVTVARECFIGQTDENVRNLSKEMLKKRQVVIVDITDPIPPSKYKESEDPCKFRSTKTGREPLARRDWIQKQTERNFPQICVYKILLFEFKVVGLQRVCESLAKSTYKELLTEFHRQVNC